MKYYIIELFELETDQVRDPLVKQYICDTFALDIALSKIADVNTTKIYETSEFALLYIKGVPHRATWTLIDVL